MIDLHVHSKYSLLDSIIEPEDLIKRVKELGRNAVCVTEHGNLYSSVEMYKLCKQNNIKYIMGCEVYICDDVEVKDTKSRYNHLVIIAKNEIGRLNLIKLVSKSSNYKYYGKPRIDFEMLKEYKDGLIISSACLGGEVMKALEFGDYEVAKNIALKYKAEFGNDYYLEYQSHKDELQQLQNRRIVDLANDIGVKYIVTTDAHYLTEEDQHYHNIFVQIGQSREVGETYNGCHIQTEDEVLNICKSTTREENLLAMQNTHEISDKCNVEIPLSAPIMPHVDTPDRFNSEIEYLKYLCAEGWHARNINKLSDKEQSKYIERLRYEVDIIERMGFEGYFLLVESYVTSVRRRGIARGSSGGSLVAYLTHIVDIDPVKYGLYFERFIDVSSLVLLEEGKITKEQLKIPDVDTDFGRQDRDKIIESIVEQYGKTRFASLGVFQYIWAKGAIKDIGKVLGIPYITTDEISKQLGDLTISEALDIGLLDGYKKDYPELIKYATRLAGLPKSFSVHPCGRVISMQDIDYYNAVELDDDGNYVLQGDMHTADDLGLVKIDLLGLRTIDIIYDTLDMIGKDYDYIAPHNMNFEDEQVLSEFKLGNTAGVFQFESKGMRGTLRSMDANSLDDLIAANALFRPGSMDFISDYANRKKGLEKFEYLHSDLAEILEPTYGIIVFQEQLIEVGRLAKLSNPDLLRQATGKKNETLMKQIYPELKEGLIKRNWTNEQVEELWEIMLRFASYSFNKSHSAAYAIIAYICMYLKVHHPKEFVVAWINSYNGKIDEINNCVIESNRLGNSINVPDWRNISDKTIIRNGEIYTGTESIKFLNGKIALELQELANNQYDTFLDLLLDIQSKTSCTKKHIDILIKLDFFSEFGSSKKLIEIVKLTEWLPKKQISKNAIDKTPFSLELLSKHGRETEKQIREINFEPLILDLIKTLPEDDFKSASKIIWEIEFLGYPKTIDSNIKEDIGIVAKLDRNQWGTAFVDIYRPQDGSTDTLKITNASFVANPLSLMEVIKTISIEVKHKKRKVDGEWVELEEKEEILIKFAKVVV